VNPSTPEVLTVGRISVDLYAEQVGASLNDVESFRKSVGGTATNVAVAAARLGHHSAVVTRVGDDHFGRYVRSALAETFDVDTAWLGVHPGLPTPLAFAVLDPPEDPELFFYRSPRAPDQEISPGDVHDDVVAGVEVLWIAASCMAWEPSRSAVTSMLAARRRRAHTVLDLDWRPQFWQSPAEATEQIAPLLDAVTIALGNRAECEVAVGTADPDLAADRLLERGLEMAVVKLGGEGVLVATASGERVRVDPMPIDVVCGLGAGDAFGGALCHGLLNGWDAIETVRFANAAGAIVAGRLMCADAMPTADEVAVLVDSVPEPDGREISRRH
jgi:5-dehydro-2-deoxygluconokinase